MLNIFFSFKLFYFAEYFYARKTASCVSEVGVSAVWKLQHAAFGTDALQATVCACVCVHACVCVDWVNECKRG